MSATWFFAAGTWLSLLAAAALLHGCSSSSSAAAGAGGQSGSGANGSGGSGGSGGAGGSIVTCDDAAACSSQSCDDGCQLACEPSTLLCPEIRFATGGFGTDAQSLDDPDALDCVLETLRDAGDATEGRMRWTLDTTSTMGTSGETTTLYLRGGRRVHVVDASYAMGGAPSGGGDSSSRFVVGPVDLAPAEDYQACLDLTEIDSIYDCLEQTASRSCP